MKTRLEFTTRALAQAKADAIHLAMISADPDYARSVQAGHTLRWAIPYQDETTLVWCVNVKERGDKALAPSDRAKLKEITKPVVEATGVTK